MDIQSIFELIKDVAIQTASAAGSATGVAAEVLPEAGGSATEAAHAAADSGIAGMFGLSWKLFIAQLINFGIVVLVLWKWVFTPVTKALQARTSRIEKSLQEATTIQKEKQEFDMWKKEQMAQARKEAATIVTSAKDEAEKVKTDIMQKAKEEQSKTIEQTKKQLEQESNKAVSEAKQKVTDIVVQATEAILQEKIDAKKDQGLISRALEAIK